MAHLSDWLLRSRALRRRPAVSVVIPCHDYGHFLSDAVGSATSQEGVEVEVVIVDDCSTDDSAAVAQRLAADDARIRLILHAQNRGHIATYNEGLAAAQGEFLVLMSADDMLAPGALARATALLDDHPGVGFVYGDVIRFSVDDRPRARTEVTGWTVWHGHDWIAARCRSGRNPTCSPEIMMRASVQRQIGDYRPDLPHAADFQMWLRAAAVADVGFVSGADQAFKRGHAASMSEALCTDPTYEIRELDRAFASVLGNGSAVPRAERMRAEARRALAARALEEALEIYLDGPQGVAAAGEARSLQLLAAELSPASRRLPRARELRARQSATGLTILRGLDRIGALRRLRDQADRVAVRA